MLSLNQQYSESQPQKPMRVNFFYIKPLQKQEEQVQDPQTGQESEAQQIKNAYQTNTNGGDQKLSILSINNQSIFDTFSDNCSINSCSLELQKIRKKYLDDYLFQSNLGKGAYGRVQKLKNKQTGKIYAGKILLKSYNATTNKYKNKKLQAQIKIYQKLAHPNIPQLYQIYTWKSQYTLIMDFVQGKSLHSVLQSHPNDQSKISRIIFQVLDTLEYLHSLNIVHHDIKPQNIIYDQKSQICKIVDFGQATQLSPNKQMDIVHKQGGTYAYFAPEIFKDQCSPKLDIWACGVVLYYLLDGKIYFHLPSREKMKRKIQSKQVQFQGYNWARRSDEAKDLIISMLEKDPVKRISAAQAKKHPWITKHCQNWINPAKKIVKVPLKNSSTRKLSLQNRPSHDPLERSKSCDSSFNGLSTMNKKTSRFCNN